MREGRFWRVLPADVRLPPLLTTAELMQYHIKSVNGLYQCQDPLIDNSQQHKASERRRLHTQICSAQLLVVISGGETRDGRCEFILYTLWTSWVFTAWLREHVCFYMTTVLFQCLWTSTLQKNSQFVTNELKSEHPAAVSPRGLQLMSKSDSDSIMHSTHWRYLYFVKWSISIFFHSNTFLRQISYMNIIFVIIINPTLQN